MTCVVHQEIMWTPLVLGMLISGNRGCMSAAVRGVDGIRGGPMTLYMVAWAWRQDRSSETDFLWLRRPCDVSSHLPSHLHLTIPLPRRCPDPSWHFDLIFHSCCESTKQGHDTGALRPLVTLGFVKRCYICWCSKKLAHIYLGLIQTLVKQGPILEELVTFIHPVLCTEL